MPSVPSALKATDGAEPGSAGPTTAVRQNATGWAPAAMAKNATMPVAQTACLVMFALPFCSQTIEKWKYTSHYSRPGVARQGQISVLRGPTFCAARRLEPRRSVWTLIKAPCLLPRGRAPNLQHRGPLAPPAAKNAAGRADPLESPARVAFVHRSGDGAISSAHCHPAPGPGASNCAASNASTRSRTAARWGGIEKAAAAVQRPRLHSESLNPQSLNPLIP